ncbi:MAG: FecR domain-containing protein [Gammaproteobacteria bacterium]|nr:FecR domain-containing protein [Gammaproteobacteria bacterium]
MKRAIPNIEVIRLEAAAWLAQLETAEMDSADLAALREWMGRSRSHVAELRRLAQLSASMNVMNDFAGPLEEAAATFEPVVRQRPGIRLYPALGLAMVFVAMLTLLTQFNRDEPEPRSLVTRVGEYVEHTLSDGSHIALNTDSRLEIAFTAEVREVTLLEGEALFTVAKDPVRPFVVNAGSRRITVVGTVFLVRVGATAVEVAVTEGMVALHATTAAVVDAAPSPDSPDSIEPVHLRERQSLKLPMNEQVPQLNIKTISDSDLRRKLAWREGLLDFYRTPLTEVVAEVSRHTGMRISILDPELREREFDGLFRVGETELLLQALAVHGDIRLTRVGADTVLLRHAVESP